MDYQGWKIYTHTGKPTHNEKRHLKGKMGGWFGQSPWWFEDNKYRTMIHNENVDSSIEIIFREETTEEEKSRGLDKYGIVFQSYPFGLRNTYQHKQLCKEVLHKITWQKQAYYLTDDGLVPVSKTRILRRKKKIVKTIARAPSQLFPPRADAQQ